jgi:hypothetical protein
VLRLVDGSPKLDCSLHGDLAVVAANAEAAQQAKLRQQHVPLVCREGRDACLVTGDPACRPTRGVRAPTGVAVSPDGRSLYIAGGRLAVFRLSSR